MSFSVKSTSIDCMLSYFEEEEERINAREHKQGTQHKTNSPCFLPKTECEEETCLSSPECPKCNNTDPRALLGQDVLNTILPDNENHKFPTSILVLNTFASSGWEMNCLNCKSCFHFQPHPNMFSCEEFKPINTRKVGKAFLKRICIPRTDVSKTEDEMSVD